MFEQRKIEGFFPLCVCICVVKYFNAIENSFAYEMVCHKIYY